jgi:trans-aconitate methyltransferase
MSYTTLAPYYDDIVGDRVDEIALITDAIKRYAPHATSLAEFGCGTGIILQSFDNRYALTGVDHSHDMLAIARSRVPNAAFIQEDIRVASLAHTVDVIISMYDTVNHLSPFTEWKRLFLNVRRNINDRGIFLFDVNTTARMNHLADHSPFHHETDTGEWTFNVTRTGDRQYRLSIDARMADGTHLHDAIDETTAPITSIRRELETVFPSVALSSTPRSDNDPEDAAKVYFYARP